MAKERIVDKKLLINLRKKQIRATQEQFAEVAGIPLASLKSYESGRRLLTAEKFSEIKRNLGYCDSSDGSLRMMIDYLRVTFKSVTDLDFFCRQYLFCDLNEFVGGETKLMKYSHLWRKGDIWIFDYADKSQTGNYQITLQLSGAGCRQFELIMEEYETTWVEVLQKMYFERKDMKVTRLDIALDEMYKGAGKEHEQYDLSDLIAKTYKKEIVFYRVKRWNHIGGGLLEFDESEDDTSQGLSIYYGSRQSNVYFNFYEKRYELAQKEKMSYVESLSTFGVWNRFEIRLAKEAAQSMVEEYVSGVDLGTLAKGLINKKMQVYNGSNEYGIYLPDKKWQKLFGGVEPLTLTVKPEPYSLEKTVKWILYQVSDSLALIDEADKMLGTQYLKRLLESGEVNEKGEEMLKFLSDSTKEEIDKVLAKEV